MDFVWLIAAIIGAWATLRIIGGEYKYRIDDLTSRIPEIVDQPPAVSSNPHPGVSNPTAPVRSKASR